MKYIQQKQHYNELWKKVDGWKNESKAFKTREPQQENLDFIEFLKKKGIRKGKVLDLGCGGGRHVVPFAKEGFESYGIDFSEEAIKLAKKFADEENVKVDLRVEDILNLSYSENYQGITQFS